MTRQTKGISRRTALKGGVGLAAGAVAMPALLSHGARASNGVVRWGIVKPWVEPITDLLAEFEADNGIKVEIVPLTGGSGVELIQQFTPGFVAGRPAVDMMTISDEATPGFARAGWLEPLDQIATEEWWSDFPQFIRDYADVWSTRDGHLYRLPTSFSTCLYVVRSDVLGEMGVSAPKTWAEIEALGKAAGDKGMAAFADALRKPALATVNAAWLSLQDGGDLFSFDAGTKAAFEFSKRLIDEGALPRRALGWSYDELNAAYASDKVLTMRQWNYVLPLFAGDSYGDWYSPEKVVVAPPPSGPNGQSATWGGGWGISIPAQAENKEGAMALATWLTAKDNVGRLRALSGQLAPPRLSIMAEQPDNVYFQALQGYIDGGFMRPRPFHVKINEAQSIVDDMYNGFLAGQMSIDEAMESGAKQIAALG